MIKLTVNGACKVCPWRDIQIYNGYTPTASCRHQDVCKYISDPDAKEKMELAKQLRRNNDDFMDLLP